MQEKNALAYGAGFKALHWLSALIICWATLSGFAVGLGVVSLDIAQWVIDFNIALTALFIPCFALRVYLRVTRYGKAGPQRVGRIANAVHISLYAVTAITLGSGLLMLGRSVEVFDGLWIPQLVHDEPVRNAFAALHRMAVSVLAGLIVLHLMGLVVGAVLGRRPLRRMTWGWRTCGPCAGRSGRGHGRRPVPGRCEAH